MKPEHADLLYLVFAIALPIATIVLVRKWWISIPLAAVCFWLILDGSGRLLNRLDPERSMGMYDTLWFLFGWIPGLIYALILFGIKIGIVTLWVKARGLTPKRTPA